MSGTGKLEGICHIAIAGENDIALGNSDGTVFVVPMEWDTLEVRWEMRRSLRLGIYCRNIRTEGLIPPEVRQLLERHRG